MSDLIERQTVIDWLKYKWNCSADSLFYGIQELPSAQPERKKGKWIFVHPLQKDDSGAYMCSCCKNGDWDIKLTDRFCKFCGADMRGEQDG